jgi:hypothetical protein
MRARIFAYFTLFYSSPHPFHSFSWSMTESSIEPSPACQAGSTSSLSAEPSVTLESTFELLLTLIHPSKRVRTPNRKTKTTKPESENKGPYEISIKPGWDAFLDVIAERLAVGSTNLVVSSFEWHWLKPASGPWLPVQDENGFTSMLKKIKSKPEPYVIIRMQAPVVKKAAGNTWDLTDELESDFEDNRVSKKVRIPVISVVYFDSISCR